MRHVVNTFLVRLNTGAAVLEQWKDRSYQEEIGEGNRSYQVIVHAGHKAATHFSVGRASLTARSTENSS